jgi:hypothetical protein
VILPTRETELLHDYLVQIAMLNTVTQRHFVSINAGNYEGTSKQDYGKQLAQVRQAYKRLDEHRKVVQSEEQERSTLPLAITAGSSN